LLACNGRLGCHIELRVPTHSRRRRHRRGPSGARPAPAPRAPEPERPDLGPLLELVELDLPWSPELAKALHAQLGGGPWSPTAYAAILQDFPRPCVIRRR
jgi:hypothetical protein